MAGSSGDYFSWPQVKEEVRRLRTENADLLVSIKRTEEVAIKIIKSLVSENSQLEELIREKDKSIETFRLERDQIYALVVNEIKTPKSDSTFTQGDSLPSNEGGLPSTLAPYPQASLPTEELPFSAEQIKWLPNPPKNLTMLGENGEDEVSKVAQKKSSRFHPYGQFKVIPKSERSQTLECPNDLVSLSSTTAGEPNFNLPPVPTTDATKYNEMMITTPPQDDDREDAEVDVETIDN